MYQTATSGSDSARTTVDCSDRNSFARRLARAAATSIAALAFISSPSAGQGSWYVSDAGEGTWQRINGSCIEQKRLRAGDFDGDGKTDVFTANAKGGYWHVSYGGTTKWQQINKSQIPIDDLRLGDFDGDGRTDVLTSSVKDGYWHISYGGNTQWKQVNKSGFDVDELRFGHQDSDRKTDVFGYFNGTWHVSQSATSSWQAYSSTSPGVADLGQVTLKSGNYVGDERADSFRSDTDGCSEDSTAGNAKEISTCGNLQCPAGYHPISYSPAESCALPGGGSDKGVARCRETTGFTITTCGTTCPVGYVDSTIAFEKSMIFDPRCDPYRDNPGAGASDLTPNSIKCWRAEDESETTGSSSSALGASTDVARQRPAIFSRRPGELDVVGLGMDDRFYHSKWNGQSWSNWAAIGVGEFLSGPAVGQLGSPRTERDRLVVIGLGKDNGFHQAVWDGQQWSSWHSIGDGRFQSAPALLSGARPTLFGRGMDRRIYSSSYRSGTWSAWTPIGDGTFTSAPTATHLGAGRVDVFARGDDRHVYQSWRDGGSWSPWQRIGSGTFKSAPAAVSWSANRLDLFAVGDDSTLWQNTWSPAGWTGWFQLDGVGKLSSAPGVYSSAVNRIDLIAIGMDDSVYHDVWLGDRWTGWLADMPTGKFK